MITAICDSNHLRLICRDLRSMNHFRHRERLKIWSDECRKLCARLAAACMSPANNSSSSAPTIGACTSINNFFFAQQTVSSPLLSRSRAVGSALIVARDFLQFSFMKCDTAARFRHGWVKINYGRCESKLINCSINFSLLNNCVVT